MLRALGKGEETARRSGESYGRWPTVEEDGATLALAIDALEAAQRAQRGQKPLYAPAIPSSAILALRPATMVHLARNGWESAYAVAGPALVPETWDTLPDRYRDAWHAAARTIAELTIADLNEQRCAEPARAGMPGNSNAETKKGT